MSLILEALKKSDAERQRTRERPSAIEAPQGGGQGRLLAMAAVVVVSLAGGWYLANLTRPEPAAPDPGPRQGAEQSSPAAANPMRADSGAHGGVDSSPEPTDQGAEAVTSDMPAVAETVPPIEPGRPAEPVTSQPPPAVVTVDVDRPNREPEPESVPGNADRWQTVPARTPAESRPPPLEEIGRPPELPRQTVDRRPLPTLGQLPSSVRAEVGSLTLNIHVYAERPDDRFVLINLKRRIEGDTLAPDLRLVEIRSDGAVLDYRGTVFLLASTL